MLTVKYTNLFKKDYKLIKRRGLNLKLLQEVVDMLANEQTLPGKYKAKSVIDLLLSITLLESFTTTW